MAATVTDYETHDPNLVQCGDLRSAPRLLTRALVEQSRRSADSHEARRDSA